jgi:hypothetical protein
MSKLKFYKKKDYLIEKVYEIARSSKVGVYRQDCNQMVLYFVRNGYLPTAMKKRAKEIVSFEYPAHKVSDEARRYLYAIASKHQVKVGYSVDPKKRLKVLQTANQEQLKLEWQVYVGDCEKEAKRQEKKLHRLLKQYHVRGEWFDIKAMYAIRSFRVRNYFVRQEEKGEEINMELDNQFFALNI